MLEFSLLKLSRSPIFSQLSVFDFCNSISFISRQKLQRMLFRSRFPVYALISSSCFVVKIRQHRKKYYFTRAFFHSRHNSTVSFIPLTIETPRTELIFLYMRRPNDHHREDKVEEFQEPSSSTRSTSLSVQRETTV